MSNGALVGLFGVAVLAIALPTAGASLGRSNTAGSTRVIAVVAAENFWGSIAAQVGGRHVEVRSIITNPNTDPHAYEPTPADGRLIAEAQFVIENGVGYDPWAPKLLAADENKPVVLDVGKLLSLSNGDNPHRWYNPADVQVVIKAMVASFSRLDPSDARDFRAQAVMFDTVALKKYNSLIAEIRAKYSGTLVGASESIFSMLAPALGLDLITPYGFLRAVSEGTEVSASDKATIDRQIKHHLIKIYVYNSQNATPDIAAQLIECKAEHIPTTTITETLAPATASYQSWQVRQLEGILAALEKATAR